ncbi:MAG: GEVED domain-containing protein, partial [Flavobacteriales bacterium]
PDMNLRVWVDMNHDGQLDDIGETLLSVDHRSPSSYTGTISIPLTAMTGPTRLRVTAKMSNLGGHSLPTPCDFPADQLGYHGEMEDYDVTIVEATGINEVAPLISAVALQPNPATDATMLSFLLSRAGDAWVEVFDATGRRVAGPLPIGGQPGVRSLRIPCGEAGLVNGVYFVQLKAEGSTQVVKLLVDN